MPGTWKTTHLVNGLHKAEIEETLSAGWEPFAVCPHGGDTYLWFRKFTPAEVKVDVKVDLPKFTPEQVSDIRRMGGPPHTEFPINLAGPRPEDPPVSAAEAALRLKHGRRMRELRELDGSLDGVRKAVRVERGQMMDELYALKRSEGWTP